MRSSLRSRDREVQARAIREECKTSGFSIELNQLDVLEEASWWVWGT